ncbi:MAG: transglutaminase domain-containing protein [Planctomycetia bacterium]|nr:transglutaminase domain-containing protein [Planctomycetia bacterium]
MIRPIERLAFVALVAALGSVATGAPPAVRHVSLVYTVEIAKLPADAKTVELWIPVASSNERQTVRLLNESELGAGRFTADKKFGNRLYYRRFEQPLAAAGGGDGAAAGEPAIKVELVYDVEVHEATVPEAKKLVATNQVAPGPEMAPYLCDTRMIPIKGRITEVARGIKLPEGEPLRAGRKIYDYLVDTMVYNYKAPGAGVGDAVWACDSKTGDCSDYNSVFIGVCRWRGIPADHMFGMPIPPDKPEGDIKYCHCWARFWVAEVGWIPIDPSRADKFPEDRDYYFGTLGSTWITLTHGRDVVLEPPQHGEPLNIFHAPVAEVDGKPFDGVRWLGHYKDKQVAISN